MKQKIYDFFHSFKNNSFQSIKHQPSSKALLKSCLIMIIIIGISEYLMLVPLNLKSPVFIIYIVCNLMIFGTLYSFLQMKFNKISKYCFVLAGLFIVYLGVVTFYSQPYFHAKSYQTQLTLNKKADFYKDNKTISYQSIPVVDRESAIKLGDRKMGQMVNYVSQFDVDESYDQINYQNKPVRVTPLEYSDLIKWFTNRKEGLPGYISVDMVSQESKVIKLKEGMKYSKSDHFSRKIERHLRKNYPTKMFDELAFEIDEQGTPYWIAPVYDYQIGPFGGKDIVGAVLVNAVNGKHQYYNIDKIPNWVDRVYPAKLIINQLENYGKYGKGYLNTLLSQKGVLQPTDGYNYLALNDDVYLYTGLTSVSKDASNVGFALINLRTKEGKYYNISGAEEYSAMSSAEGKVQNLHYDATFPILINAGGEPTYFLSLKDSSNLVKQYAFVSVKNYQIVATGSTVAEAEKAYYATLGDNGKTHTKTKKVKLTGTVSQITAAVKEGNSYYYFKLEGSDTVYIAPISISDHLPLLQSGQQVTIHFLDTSSSSQVVSEIEYQ